MFKGCDEACACACVGSSGSSTYILSVTPEDDNNVREPTRQRQKQGQGLGLELLYNNRQLSTTIIDFGYCRTRQTNKGRGWSPVEAVSIPCTGNK